MSLISGRRRSGTVTAGTDCIVIESPRRNIIKLINSEAKFQTVVNQTSIIRMIQSLFAPNTPLSKLKKIASQARLNHYKAEEILIEQGEDSDELHIIRSGSVIVSYFNGEQELVAAYIPAGHYVGVTGLLGKIARTATVKASIATETFSIRAAAFEILLENEPALVTKLQQEVKQQLTENALRKSQTDHSNTMSFLMKQGLGQATDVLVIDESVCVGCDNCESACAETHQGVSRLDRKAGPSIANIHIPTSCRHCEHPHCMKDCPPDAIHRAKNGEVFIDDSCIGCANCERNCPYGVIQMAAIQPQSSFWERLFNKPPVNVAKTAVKCDMCKDLSGGPACVRACPTGAAIRISPERLVDLVQTD